MAWNKQLPSEPMTKVFVCSPLRPVSRDPERAEKVLKRNIERAKYACELLTKLGYLPIAPHLYFPQFLDDNDPKERETGMMLGRELLCGCDELWVFGERISEGMEAEIRQAKASDIPVRYCDEPERVVINMLNICEEMIGKSGDYSKENFTKLAPIIAEKAAAPVCMVIKVADVIREVIEEDASAVGGERDHGEIE